MTMMSVNFATSENTPNVDAPASSRWKRDSGTSSSSGANAFAASLANAMSAPMTTVHVPKQHGAASDLDAQAHSLKGTKAGSARFNLSKGAAKASNSAAAPASDTITASKASAAAGIGTPGGSDSDTASTGAVGTGADADVSRATSAYDGNAALAAAADARAAVANTPVESANSGVDALNPDFRAKFARVVTRMHDEYGKDVELVEGYRTQSRQDFLYNQGRTEPGDVVTWTKSSKHTLGLAADVTINGSYADAVGYQQLAQIAAQEGLRTLGPKDPGHIEMPTRSGAAAWGSSVSPADIDSNVSRAIGIALDQNSVSESADDGSGGFSNLNGLLSRVGSTGFSGTPQFQLPVMTGSNAGLSGGMSQRNPGDTRKDDTKRPDAASVASVASVADVANVAQVAQVAHVGALTSPQQPLIGAPITASTTVGAGSNSADKVGHLLDARDAAPVQPMSQVTLNVDNPTGSADKITVQLRGGVVDTAISIGDPNRADKMSLRVGELQHALEQHGLETTAINVASTAADSGPGWNPRQGSDQSAQYGRSSLNHGNSRQDADATRQRARKEQQGGRQK